MNVAAQPADAPLAPPGEPAPTEIPAAEMPAELVGFHLPRRTKFLILAGALLAMFLSAMEQTVVSTAIPRMVSELGGLHLIAWVTTAFMLASLTVVPIAGRLSDVYGRKPFLLAGLVVFLLGSAISGFAQNMEQLITFRAVQGLGAGVLMANTMAISGDLFPPAERGKYIGLFASVFGISAVIGPTLGGFLTDELSWRWVFWVNLPLGALSIIVIAVFMPWLRPPKRKIQIDYLGVVTLLWMLVPALLALALVGGTASWTDLHILAMFAASVLGLGAFLRTERRARDPIIPLSLFRNRTFAIVALVFFGLGAGLFGVTFFIPLFVQGVIGKTATQAGAIITPEMLSIVVMVVISGQIISRTGHYKNVALVGAVIMLIGVISMTQMDSSTTVVGVIWRLVVFGAGMGLLFPVLTLAAQNALPQRMLGTVSGSTQFFESIGGLVGITVFGALLNSRITSELAARLPDDLAGLANPQQLIDPAQRESLIASIGADAFATVSLALREALSLAVTTNFWVSTVVGVGIIVALLGLKELRLRTATDLSPDGEDGPGGAPGDENDPDIAPGDEAEPDVVPDGERDPGREAAAASLSPPPPRLPPRGRRRGELAAALFLGSAMGLAAAVSARGSARPAPHSSAPAAGDRARRQGTTLWQARRRMADWLDPPLSPPRAPWWRRIL